MEPIKDQPNTTVNNQPSTKISQEKSQEKSPYTNSSYPGNPYTQTEAYVEKRPDTIFTQRLKDHFPFFSIGSLLYAFFYAFCLYKNASGITYPFFAAGTLYYFFFSMKKLGVPCKKNSVFYMISIVMLGISNCLTNSQPILIMNKCGIFLLSFILMIHTVYIDQNWNMPKYLSAIFQTFGTIVVSVFRPFSDMISYFDAQKQKKEGKKNYFLPVMIGIAITIPLLFFITILLAAADVVFSNILNNILDSLYLSTLFEILFLIILVFFISYAVYAALCMKNVKEETIDHRTCEPIIAIIVTSALSVLYLVFSAIQIIYLFIGNMQLPYGYTYSSYAREGYFQLLIVCILNLGIVLFCLHLFRENIVLKIILTIISGCTFIMILSSALRMLMYINRYNLTFLRILVLWSLTVIFLLMAGITVYIYMNKFPLFTYSMAIVTVFYLALSFSHPDYWIAKYNLSPEHLEYLNDYDTFDNRQYLSRLSADAAPILLDQTKNPDCIKSSDSAITELFAPAMESDDWDMAEYFNEEYYKKIQGLLEDMHIRNFNFSVYCAGKYLY